jgi:outer membrane protein assembly factor BamB
LLVTSLTVAMIASSSTLDAQSAVSAGDPIEGRWHGTAGFPEDRVDVSFEFKARDRGQLIAFVYRPVANFYGMALPGRLTKDGETYSVRAIGLSLSLRGDRLEGREGPLGWPISLARAKSLPSEGPVPKYPAGTGPRWRTKLGTAVYATAAVRSGVAYVGTGGGVFYAVNLSDGAFVWNFPAGRPIYGEALATEEAVYFVCDNGFLYKLDRLTGRELWRYDLGDSQVGRILPHQVDYYAPHSGDFDFDRAAPRPLLVDGVVYVGSGDGGFHAVGDSTGRRVWRFATSGKLRTDAVTVGDVVIFGGSNDTLYAVSRSTGKEQWRQGLNGPVTGSPAVMGETVLVGHRNGALLAIDAAAGRVLWRRLFWGSAIESTPAPDIDGTFFIGSSDMRRVSHIAAADGRVLWRTDVLGWAWSRPLVWREKIYEGAIGIAPYGIRHLPGLVALDRASGRVAWRWVPPVSSDAFLTGFAASPAAESGTLVIGSLDGTLYGFTIDQ